MGVSSNATAKSRRRPAPRVWLIALCCAALPVAGAAAEPLALQGIMKDMGRNMQAIVGSLLREDYAAIELAAMAVANHPQPPFSEKLRVMAFAGSNAPRFKAFDGETHDNAMALARTAKSGDGEAVIAAYGKLQSSCLACHQTFRKPFAEQFYGKADGRR
jgi:cytochrome c556